MKINKRFQIWWMLLVVVLWGAVGCNSATPTLSVLVSPVNIPDQVDASLSVLTTPQVEPEGIATPASGLPTATPTLLPPPVHPADMRSGIESVDRVLDGLFGVDGLQFDDVVAFTAVPCSFEDDGLGGPPACREGESEGDLVEVLAFTSPSMHYLRRDEIERFPGVKISGVYAIYRIREELLYDSDYPAGSYAILCIGEAPGPDNPLRIDLLLRVTDEGVISITDRWDEPPQDLLSMLARDDIIVAPVE